MRVVRHDLIIPNLPPALKGATLAQLTDIHRSWCTSDALIKKAVEITNAEKPAIIVLTGDFVTGNRADIAPCMEMLAPLKAFLGTYFILGNHDYTTDAPAVTKALEGIGFHSLVNRNVCFEEGLWMVGLDDDRCGVPDYSRALEGVPSDAHFIALCHNPVMMESLVQYDCTILSGHTHGGQIVVPVLTAAKIRHIGSKNYWAGWYQLGKARTYVSRGIGNVALPLRLFAPPEVTFFTLLP